MYVALWSMGLRVRHPYRIISIVAEDDPGRRVLQRPQLSVGTVSPRGVGERFSRTIPSHEFLYIQPPASSRILPVYSSFSNH